MAHRIATSKPSKLEEIADENCELEMTPMIDVTFLLLVFFLCTIKFKTLEGKLAAYLPKEVGQHPTEFDPKEPVALSIHVVDPGAKVFAAGHPRAGEPWDGTTSRYDFDGRLVAYRVGPQRFEDPEELTASLTATRARFPDRDASIEAGAGVVYADVVVAMDALERARFGSITFVAAPR